MAVIYLFLAGLAVFFFYKKMYVPFLFTYIGILTNLFMLDPTETSSAFCGDVCILLSFALLPILPRRYEKAAYERGDKGPCYTFFPRGDSLGLFLLAFSAFYVFEFVLTLVSEAETLVPAFKVIRLSLLPVSYIVLKCVPLSSLNKFFKYGLYVTLFQGVLYYLQFAGIHLLAGYDKEKAALEGFNFAMNNPTFTVFYIFYCLKSERFGKWRYAIVLYLVGMVLLTFTRMHIISVFLGVALYLMMNRNRQQTIIALLALALMAPAVILVFNTKAHSRTSSAAEDVSQVLSDFSNLDMYTAGAGSFTFRAAMLAERFTYLIENPEYLLLGVGTIHEDSPKCYNRFNFFLGTVNLDKVYGQCIIESGDNAWVPVTLRYGLIGILVHLAYFVVFFLFFVRRKDDLFIIAPLIMIAFLDSFSSVFFESPLAISMFLLYAAWASRADIENRKVQI